jgi:hypothetical protein
MSPLVVVVCDVAVFEFAVLAIGVIMTVVVAM